MSTQTKVSIAWAAGALFLCLCALRIQTHVTAQDPDSYRYLARQVATLEPGSPAFREALFYVAPGFPALLAVVRLVFGEFAGSWVNLFFALLLFAAMAGLLARLPDPDRHAPLALLGAIAFVFLGQGGAAWFLLYPFRETSALALGLTGYWSLATADTRNRGLGRLWVAALLLLAAVSVRESMLMVWVPAVAWIWNRFPKARGRALLPFALPLFVVALTSLLLAMWGWNPVQHLLRIVARFDVGRLSLLPGAVTRRVALSTRAHAGMLYGQLGAFGVALLALGLWRLRRDLVARYFLAVPALLLFFFYAFFPPHRRYMLSMLVFLAPIAGFGLAVLCRYISERLRARYELVPFDALPRAVAGLLALLLLGYAATTRPWGRTVTRGEVRRLVDACGEFAAPGDAFYTERGCRWINNALAMYGPFRIDVDPSGLAAHIDSGHKAFFLTPLDAAAFYPADLHRFPLPEEIQWRHRLDLVPVSLRPGHWQTLNFAGAQYQVLRLRPWSQQQVRTALPPRLGGPHLIWLDVRGSDPAAPKTIRFLDRNEQALGEWHWPGGNGMAAVILPAEPMAERGLSVEVTSSEPLPSCVVSGYMPLGRLLSFDLRASRNLSVENWFSPPIPSVRSAARAAHHPVMVVPETVFYVPPILGGPAELEVLLVLRLIGDFSGSATIVNWLDDRELSRHVLQPGQVRQWNSFVVPAAGSGDTPRRVRMHLEGLHPAEAHLRIEQVRVWLRAPDPIREDVKDRTYHEDHAAFLEFSADDRRHRIRGWPSL